MGELYGFLRTPLSPVQARERITGQLQRRTGSFLDVLRRGVYAREAGPYRRLLDHAGIAFDDVARWAERQGVEAALARLYDAGVYVRLEELKGRRPIRRSTARGTLELHVKRDDFDNPLVGAGIPGRSSGSRGPGSLSVVDRALLEHDTAHNLLGLEAFNLHDRPVAVWRSPSPAGVGRSDVLRTTKRGARVERWFSPTSLKINRAWWGDALVTYGTLAVARAAGHRLPAPRHVPPGEAAVVARWLADVRRRGTPGLVETVASGAVRVCVAAREDGLDIAGSIFRVGGEPLTHARERVVAEAGCLVLSRYSMSEAGNLGFACARPKAVDDVHVATDKVALLQRPREVGTSGVRVDGLILTTLLSCSPKLLLNVEIDDYGVLAERSCGCLLGELGLDLHLHTIRSYDKLTTAGWSYLGLELLDLLDDVLPARFGGAPGDYQLVEEEDDNGLPRVYLVVHPRVPETDDDRIARAVLAALGTLSEGRRMTAQTWEDGEVLHVVRREPYLTGPGKILPLHLRPRPHGR